jgi:GNAT superfamily N-acetyltransferase
VIFDPELVRRIESSAARVSMATVAGFIGHAANDPARAVAFGDGALIAFGPGRYVNRAVGISLDDLGDEGVDELEAFYAASGVPPSLEVASWAPASLIERLGRRGYVVEWFRNVYVSEVDGHHVPPHPSMVVREVTPEMIPEWLAVLRAGFQALTPAEATRSDEMARAAHAVAGATAYVADLDGVSVGCASLTPDGGIAWLGGAATVPSGRRRGVQGALVRHRMAVAATQGCDLAVVTAMPAGDSARNLARLGFTLAYCQVVLTKAAA